MPLARKPQAIPRAGSGCRETERQQLFLQRLQQATDGRSIPCFAVEFSQLIHLPMLDALRRTTLGYLVLGSGFDRRDLAGYAGGVPRRCFSNGRWHEHRTDRAGRC
jgi:hypothetical protein